MEEKKAKMLKFIMGKGHQPSAERLKVQKELFGFNRVWLCLILQQEKVWNSHITSVQVFLLFLQFDEFFLATILTFLKNVNKRLAYFHKHAKSSSRPKNV